MKIFKKLMKTCSRKSKKPSALIPEERGSRELINFEEMIGYDVHPATGKETPTAWGIMHHSKDGAHIVPSRPPQGSYDDIDEGYALLSVQRALLGEVTPNLRAVVIDFQEKRKSIRIVFFYDQIISEEMYDNSSCIITEIIAAFPPEYHLEERIERLDHPEQIPIKGRLAYLRKE